MKLATWNVNSLKIRLPHVLDWLARNPVEVLCLQETKLTDDKFPRAELQDAGYDAAFIGQKTYNGVAVLWQRGLTTADVVADIPGFEDDQKRVLSVTVNGVRVVCAYFPNGQSLDSEKYPYKLRWIEALHAMVAAQIEGHSHFALLGDYNIAPEDRDVHDPAAWVDQVLVSEKERAAFRKLEGLGLVDAYRLFEQPEKSFSWWDYRMLGFQKNHGLRIDHILLSKTLAPLCTACAIDRQERKKPQPSDHAPVVATLTL